MTDVEIMKKLRRRDADIFAYINTHYSKLLWVVAGNILGKAGTAEDIEDCISDVYVKLLENPKLYDAEKGTLKSFLVQLVKNQAIDRYRLLARTRTLSDSEWELVDESAVDPVHEVLRREENSQVHRLLDMVGRQDREIMVRRFFHNEKPTEISEKMNLDKKLVDNRLYQTKRKLRNAINRKDGTL